MEKIETLIQLNPETNTEAEKLLKGNEQLSGGNSDLSSLIALGSDLAIQTLENI